MRFSPLLLAALVAALLVAPAASTAATPRKGPAGLAFYTPPKKLPGKKHGDVVWTRSVKGGITLSGASKNLLVLYRSTTYSGSATAVSGVLSLPKGKAPRGGWPVVSWAHGTTGIADVCAPSRFQTGAADSTYTAKLMNGWLKRGYAVAQTDYQGLGTPGTHEYLVGTSEGRSVLDMVRAARQVDRRIGKDFAIAGHSQGGHASLWAAYLARRWTPELKLRGTVAFAPASHLGEQFKLAPSVTSPVGGAGALLASIARGVDAARPSLRVSSLLTDRAAALYPQIDGDRCLGQLAQSDSFGGLAPSELFKSGTDLGPLDRAVDASDPERLKIGGAPVEVEQGSADGTVQPGLTDQLVEELRDRGTRLTYRRYEGADHVGVVSAATSQATRFLDARLR